MYFTSRWPICFSLPDQARIKEGETVKDTGIGVEIYCGFPVSQFLFMLFVCREESFTRALSISFATIESGKVQTSVTIFEF